MKLTDVIARRPILGTGDPPRELVESALLQSIYVDTTNDERPEVRVERVEVGGSRPWRVEVRGGLASAMSGPPIDMHRAAPEELAEEIGDSIPTTGFRPEWTDVMWEPRTSPDFERVQMRRMNGRPAQSLIVFGADDRQVFKDPSYPWGCVGRVLLTDGHKSRYGTGVLVGDRIVATASHLVPWGALAYGLFQPAFYDGMSLHLGGSGATISWVDKAKGYEHKGDVCGWDWAILRLSKPLGELVGFLGYNGYSSDWNYEPYWTVVGYPGNPGGGMRPSRQSGVTIRDVDSDSYGGRELESRTADLSPGNSGGPIWSWWQGEDFPRMVGVVSGAEYDWEWGNYVAANVFAGGSGFTNLVTWGRQHWPK